MLAFDPVVVQDNKLRLLRLNVGEFPEIAHFPVGVELPVEELHLAIADRIHMMRRGPPKGGRTGQGGFGAPPARC